MTWTRLPDDFTDRPEVLLCSRSARLLHVEALVWCNRLLTNGVIPVAALSRITDSADIADDVNELARAGLWWTAESDQAAWQIDWTHQESADDVKDRQRLTSSSRETMAAATSPAVGRQATSTSTRICTS